MASEMIERAARALAANHILVSDGHYKMAARAVLQAIREPSHAMCVIGDPDRFAPGDSEAIWQAMIDAALVE